MSRIPEKIIAGLLALFLSITVGYHVYISLYGTIKTETVFDYTVLRSISADGIAIRSETVIGDKPSGIENCIFDDGVRVSVGENIAEFYKNEQSNENLKRIRELEAEIKMLEEAQDNSTKNFSGTDMLNRDIKEQLSHLAGITDNRRFQNSGEIKAALTSIVNKKQVATGKVDNFNARIRSLKEEYSALVKNGAEINATVTEAPVSGFFSTVVDGYEDSVKLDRVNKYSAADYLAMIDAPVRTAPFGKIGKIVTTQNWIFAAACDKANLEFVKPGQEVSVTFDSINQKIPAVITDILQDNDKDRIVLILSCNQITGDILSLRVTSAVINFNQYSGVRINMSDIRFRGNERGVYILDNNTVRFKLIDPVYEEQTFVLSKMIPPNLINDEYVGLFDQVITKGNDLYDGKVIQ